MSVRSYRKFAPYLLTAFFFIFINNIMGLILSFPEGQRDGKYSHYDGIGHLYFLAVNIFGTKTYWIRYLLAGCALVAEGTGPHDAVYRVSSYFHQTFALMIRLFANMLAGHMAMLVLTCLIFISASMGLL